MVYAIIGIPQALWKHLVMSFTGLSYTPRVLGSARTDLADQVHLVGESRWG